MSIASLPTLQPGIVKDKAVPQWAIDNVFSHAAAVAWVGEASPLVAAAIFPLDAPFAKRLPPANNLTLWHESIHPLDRARVQKHFANLATYHNRRISTRNNSIDYRLMAADGDAFWIRHTVVNINKNENKTLIRGFVFDIGLEKQHQHETILISEHEQMRVGQDLHDDVCQMLTGISCLVQVSAQRLKRKVPAENAKLLDINKRIIDTMDRARAICHGLLPPVIFGESIRETIQELARQSSERFSVKVKAVLPPAAKRLPLHTQAQLLLVFRIAQESICNSIRHGKATRIILRLTQPASPGAVSLSIEDNGCGLSQSKSEQRGIGLHIMRSRAALLGGEITFTSGTRSGKGCTVSLTYFPH